MQSLYQRASEGDAYATRTIVDALRPRLNKMAAYYARCSGEDADDLVQEAWLGLLEALPALDVGIGSPAAYLVQHARWRLLDAIRRARARRLVPLEDACLDLADPHEAPITSACVSDFTRQLKPVQREVLGLLTDGLTWREAGGALGCTSANIAYHVRQIRRRYEEWLTDDAKRARRAAFSVPAAARDRGCGGAPHTAPLKGGGCMTKNAPAPEAGRR